MNVRRVLIMLLGAAPALLAFAADAGAFTALGGKDVGMACVGVAPAQVGVQVAGKHGVVGMVGGADDEGAQRPELRLDRVGPGGVGRRKAQLDLVPFGPGADRWGLVRGQIVQDHVDRAPSGRAARIDLSAARVGRRPCGPGSRPTAGRRRGSNTRGSSGCRGCADRSPAAAQAWRARPKSPRGRGGSRSARTGRTRNTDPGTWS